RFTQVQAPPGQPSSTNSTSRGALRRTLLAVVCLMLLALPTQRFWKDLLTERWEWPVLGYTSTETVSPIAVPHYRFTVHDGSTSPPPVLLEGGEKLPKGVLDLELQTRTPGHYYLFAIERSPSDRRAQKAVELLRRTQGKGLPARRFLEGGKRLLLLPYGVGFDGQPALIELVLVMSPVPVSALLDLADTLDEAGSDLEVSTHVDTLEHILLGQAPEHVNRISFSQ
ncbi:MAG: hypothetical protein KDK91_06490, partial [Gammaproteobacteria bacterium]|nr:hypothetical protein [Gammaproteobacteria bacterium]